MKLLVPTLATRAGVAPSVVEAVLEALTEVMRERRDSSGSSQPLESAFGALSSVGGQAVDPVAPHVSETRQTPLPWGLPVGRNEPSPAEIDDLISRATSHPMGLAFLLEGHLGAVAVTFQTHAFTVEAARRRLR